MINSDKRDEPPDTHLFNTFNKFSNMITFMTQLLKSQLNKIPPKKPETTQVHKPFTIHKILH